MAKKKTTKKPAKKKSGTKKSKTGDFVNLMKLGGMAAVAFGKPKIDAIGFVAGLDPKLKAAGYILLGEYLPKQSAIKNMVKDESLLRGAGDALIYEGVKELMTSFGIAGVDEQTTVLSGDDELAIALEGIDDIDTVNGDDLDTVNGDDDDDLLSGLDDDIDTVNGDDDLDSFNGDDEDY